MKTETYDGLKEELFDIAVETFELMCYMFPLDDPEVDYQSEELIAKNIGALATFDGASEGGLLMRVSPGMIDAIAANMLGEDETTMEQKYGALCEIVNIICGNIAPFFTSGQNICYIRPPKILTAADSVEQLCLGKKSETVLLHVDEGVVEITVYYS